MNLQPDILRLAQALAACAAHRQALNEALADLRSGQLTPSDMARLGKEQRRLLDQFAYRYPRLQDDMGASSLSDLKNRSENSAGRGQPQGIPSRRDIILTISPGNSRAAQGPGAMGVHGS